MKKEGETDYRCHKYIPGEEKKWRCVCNVFMTNSLREGAI